MRLLIFALICISISFSCRDKHSENEITPQVITVSENRIVTFTGHDNLNFHGNMYIPEGKGPYPVVIIMHGCGGLYRDEAHHIMESHFTDWVEMLRDKKVVTLFLDSFAYPRGFSSFCSKAPPQDAVCSPAYERTKDVNDALSYLSTLDFVNKDKIGLLGFSQGAETVVAAALNTNLVQKNKWTVNSGSVTYEVPSPVILNPDFTIRAVVAYYPGLGFYSYFGSPNNYMDGKYIPVAPLLLNSASEDPLYTSGATESFYKRALQSGVSEASTTEVILTVYPEANHSFDGKTSGPDGIANTEAKKATMQWFEKYLLH